MRAQGPGGDLTEPPNGKIGFQPHQELQLSLANRHFLRTGTVLPFEERENSFRDTACKRLSILH